MEKQPCTYKSRGFRPPMVHQARITYLHKYYIIGFFYVSSYLLTKNMYSWLTFLFISSYFTTDNFDTQTLQVQRIQPSHIWFIRHLLLRYLITYYIISDYLFFFAQHFGTASKLIQIKFQPYLTERSSQITYSFLLLSVFFTCKT